MFSNGSNLPYSLAVAPVNSGSDNGGWGGDGGWWVLIILFALFGGWGGNGFGGNGGGALTRSDLCQDMNFGQLEDGVRNVNDSVNVGFANLNSTICHQQYDTAMLINGVTGAVNNGFSSLNSTICQQQYDTANMLNQMNTTNMMNANALSTEIAQCCCDTQRSLDGINYNMAQNTCAITNTMNNNTRDIIDNQNAGTRAILDYLCQEKISDLQNENNALRLAASQERQNAYLIDQLNPRAVPAYPAASPCGLGNWSPQVLSNGYGYNNGCCGCGC